MAPPHAFSIEVTPLSGDIDALEHVSNVVYLRWILEVALAHSDGKGWDMAAYKKLGSVWVVKRHEIDYLRSAVAGDRIRLSTWVDGWGAASCTRHTEIARAADDVVLCRAQTKWVFMSLESGRPVRIPNVLLEDFDGPVRAAKA